MYAKEQVAITYFFIILHNVYSSKKCVDSQINLISLKIQDCLMYSANPRKVSEHLPDYFQPTVFNLHVARMTFHALLLYWLLGLNLI